MTAKKELETEPMQAAVNGNGAQRTADLTNIDDVQSLLEQTVAQINYWNGRLEVLTALRDQLRGE